MPLRAQPNCTNEIKLMIPVQSPLAKIFRLTRRANQFYQLARLTRERGVSRSSRTRDGMRWTRQRWAREVCSQGGFP